MTVFAVQVHQWVNPRTGNLEAKYDLSPAEEFGEIVVMLNDQAHPSDPSVLQDLHDHLKNYTDSDWLLLVGNPAIIGAAAATAAFYNEGRLRMLHWSGKHRRYQPVVMNI